jgi:ABC-type sugar transport system permease subunit
MMTTMDQRLAVAIGTILVFALFALWVGQKPWRWAFLLPVALPIFIVAQFKLVHLPELLQGASMIFGLLGSGFGLLGLTHTGRR